MGGLVTKRNAAMFLAVVMMIASAMTMVNAHESESIELTIRSFQEDDSNQAFYACCPSKTTWTCFKDCMRKQRKHFFYCSPACGCKVVQTLTKECVRDESAQIMTEMFLKEQVSQKLSACSQNAQNCYRTCRLTGSQQRCANFCSCELVTKLNPNFYQGVNEIPKLQHGIDGEPKLSAQD